MGRAAASGQLVTGRYVVLGGYGAVGRDLAARLVASGYPVVIAGRDPRRATAAAAAYAGARAATVDLSAPAALGAVLRRGDVVVNCTGLEDPRIAAAAIDAGSHFIDIAATIGYLDALAQLHDTAMRRDCTVGCSVGLAPGLTNLLAADIHRRHPDARPIDITVLLGLGDDYGAAARDWTLARLGTTFADPVDGRPVPNFSDGRRVALPAGFGRRRAYRFDLADQHTLTRTLGRPVTTRLAFDPAAMTSLAAGVARLPPVARAAAHGIRRLQPARMGSTWFAGRVERVGGPVHWAVGPSQSQATAAVTAVVARLLRDGELPRGVHHLDEVATYRSVYDDIDRRAVSATPPNRSAGSA